ncbi:MAG: choice-of-anchor J domain-containing protein [Ignavibacteria bacterium]|nr:choice-of-anchor J domain-containing protein [Ignavibacteria bacterium]MBT8383242.1 choice-of-anchor J domain-containing protein [Ignavibacteria bacterium]MBT8391734.1 choice-of-anchor J domain-containing protein [Ignavibacteria bacterium]NNJ51592.1 T9SS type A sorting domain-containing protein [Ignavibacteriaceae bacterium]NNL21317.1 T9SS type A sorting domain-containing protein [Ignavibacteriaceae bacterium]
MHKLLSVVFMSFLFGCLLFAQNNNQRDETINKHQSPINRQGSESGIFFDDMNGVNSVAGLEARGWVILNEDGGGTQPPFAQGDPVVFAAYEGPDTGYTFTNYQGANGFLIDQWLISPEIAVSSGDTLKFWHRSPDANPFDDSIYVRYATNAGITPGDFDQTWGRYLVSETGWAQWVGTFNHTGNIRFAIQYYITDGGPSGNNSNYVGLDLFEVTGASGPTILTIAEAREDLDNDFIPDRLGDTVTVAGTVSSINYNTGNFNYVLHDGTGGITSIKFGYAGPEYNMGDILQVTGEIGQFRGLTQIEPLGDGSSSVVFQGTGGALPDFILLTLSTYYANPEMYEGELLGFVSLSSSGPWNAWPTSGSNANFVLQDAAMDTIIMRIDKETDLDENPEPSWPKDVIGFGSQFTSSSGVYDDGYQLLPRMYSEILPPGTIPVELTSFTAYVVDQNIMLKWSTSTETNNLGFEVEKKTGTEFRAIGFINGSGTTTEPQEYSFTDVNSEVGVNYYRLKQVDLDGSYSYSEVVEIELGAPVFYSLEQNYPNPFNPSTKIVFNLAADAKVTLKVFDVLGQEVSELVNSQLTAGNHVFTFDALLLNSGVYFYRIDTEGIDGSSFTQVKKMLLTK